MVPARCSAMAHTAGQASLLFLANPVAETPIQWNCDDVFT